MLDPRFAPAIRAGFRLQWEEAQQCHVLLYPEGMVRLNEIAATILQRCDGSASIEQIVQELEEEFDGSDIDRDVRSFLSAALAEGWIVVNTRN